MPATTRKGTRKRGGSRKVDEDNAGSGHSRRRRVVATSIPELKRSFDALESEVGRILRNPNEAQRIRQFQEAWRRIFGRPVEPVAASAYLQVKSRDKGRGKSRKAQRGGAGALAGAPLDFQTRPGIDGVYGSFPPYITQGFGFYNTVNQEGMAKDCGSVDITPKVPADLGSNEFQKGGGMLADAISAVMNRPVTSASPPGLLDEVQASWKGRDPSPSPGPEQNPLKYR